MAVRSLRCSSALSTLPVLAVALLAAVPAVAQTENNPQASQQNPAPNTSADPAAASAAAGNTSPSSDSTDPASQNVSGAVPSASSTDVVVTGSRIARPELATVQPTQIIGAQQIESRGYTNITNALQELPSFGPPGNSGVGAQSSLGPSQSFVDFFSLGTQRTLTLVNGRRFVSSNTSSIFGPVSAGSQVDLNNIPVTLVDRIDVVAVGGAPIYGSDAIAGTVNIILKKNFEGLNLGGEYGISERGDGPDRRANILVGKNFADGRGNIVLSGEYNSVEGFTALARDVTYPGLFFGTPPTRGTFARVLYPDQRYTAFTAGGVPFTADDVFAADSGIKNAAGQALQFGQDGNLVPIDFGNVLRQGYISSGGNGFSTTGTANLLTNSERYVATALANYAFSDHLHFFGEGWYTHNSGTNITDQPNYNTGLFDAAGTPDGNLVLNINNPYLTPQTRALIASNLPAGQTDFYVGRASTDITPGRSQATVELYRFVGGFNGDFTIGSRNFTWEASANYGHSTTTGHNKELVQQNFANALDAVRDASGNIVCRPGYTSATIATGSATCAPLNLFGAGNASQAALNYIFADATPISTNSQLVLNVNAQGSIVRLPGGDAKFSIGYEHRRETSDFDPGAYYYGEVQPDGSRVQYGRTIPFDPINGEFHTNEVFGELTAPLVSPDTGLRFLKVLEADGSARYVHNSLSGGDVTWTAGGRLGFFSGVTFRGNFTHAIRSPAITEVFNPTSQIFDTGNDPCDGRFVGSGPNPANRRANCVAAGIANPETFDSNFSNYTVRASVSGNSWTAGAIIQPSGFLRGFTAAIDWVDIQLRDAITSVSGQDILNACYDGASFPNSFCGLVDRDRTGQITFIREGYFNAASYTFKGLTVNAAYRRPLQGGGSVGLAVNYLYRDTLQTQVGVGDINHLAGEIGNPTHSGTANITFEKGGFNSLVQVQYFGKARFDMDDAPNARDVTGVGDWAVVNATVGFNVNKQFGIKLIVDNIADAKPPYPYTGGYNATQSYFSGIIGRFYRAAVTARF
jgi:iron complex outermembrane receptor protein